MISYMEHNLSRVISIFSIYVFEFVIFFIVGVCGDKLFMPKPGKMKKKNSKSFIIFCRCSQLQLHVVIPLS